MAAIFVSVNVQYCSLHVENKETEFLWSVQEMSPNREFGDF